MTAQGPAVVTGCLLARTPPLRRPSCTGRAHGGAAARGEALDGAAGGRWRGAVVRGAGHAQRHAQPQSRPRCQRQRHVTLLCGPLAPSAPLAPLVGSVPSRSAALSLSLPPLARHFTRGTRCAPEGLISSVSRGTAAHTQAPTTAVVLTAPFANAASSQAQTARHSQNDAKTTRHQQPRALWHREVSTCHHAAPGAPGRHPHMPRARQREAETCGGAHALGRLLMHKSACWRARHLMTAAAQQTPAKSLCGRSAGQLLALATEPPLPPTPQTFPARSTLNRAVDREQNGQEQGICVRIADLLLRLLRLPATHTQCACPRHPLATLGHAWACYTCSVGPPCAKARAPRHRQRRALQERAQRRTQRVPPHAAELTSGAGTTPPHTQPP